MVASCCVDVRTLAQLSHYDGLGRLVHSSLPAIHPRSDWLDVAPAAGWSATVHSITNYDALDRPTRQTAFNEIVTRFVYSANRTSSSYSEGRAGSGDAGRRMLGWSRTDRLGRLIATRSYGWSGSAWVADGDVLLGYDLGDNLTSVDHADSSAQTLISYDKGGRKLTMDDPDLGLWRYAYDRQGRLVRQEDAGGNVTCLYYDSVERLTDKRFLGNAAACPAAAPAEGTAQSISYLYSSAGSSRGQVVESARFGEGGVTWYVQTHNYDALGRLAGTVVKLSPDLAVVSTSYGYDAWHRPSTVSYFGGELLTTTYNGMGLSAHLTRTVGTTSEALVSGSAIGGNGQADGVEYDAQGRLVKMHLGEGNLWRTQRYGAYVGEELPDNRSGLLTNIEVGTQGDSDAYLDLAYSYDSFGNLKTLTEGTAVSTFSYDDQNRLTSAFGRSFAFTPAGSFTSFEGKAATYTATPLHGLNTLNGLDVYEYDPSGRVVERTVGGVAQTLGWTAAGELRSVSVGGVTQESYRYDPNGERIVQARAGGAATYTFFPHYEVSLDDGVGTAVRSYFFNGQRIAQKVDDGALTYLHTDHLGSTVLTTGVSGSKKYHAYGGTRGGSVPTEWQYTGQELDGGTGLVYMHARYYDPATGQFLSPDTIVPEPTNLLSYNRYLYSYGNPLRYTDPTGYYSDDEIMQHFGCSDWACVMGQFGDGGILAGLAGWLNVLMLAQDGDSVSALAYQAMAGGMGAMPNIYEGTFLRQGNGVGSIQVQMAQVTLADGYTAGYSGSAAGSSDQFARLAGASTLHGSYALAGHGVSAAFSRGTYTRNACNTWDCMAIGLDVASLAASIGQTAAAACTAATLGACSSVFAVLTYADIGINGLQLAHSTAQFMQGEASLADMSLAVAQTGPSSTPVIGMASDAVWLAYDIFVEPWSPTHRWGAAKAAR